MKDMRWMALLIACVFLAGCDSVLGTSPAGAANGRLEAVEHRVDDMKPGLGEIMSVIQQHHAKLYYAGSLENWELADYQLDEIKEGLEDAAKYHPQFKTDKTPLTDLIPTMTKLRMEKVAEAIKGKNKNAFAQAFHGLTESCNRCHQVAEHGFIVIQVPAVNEFANQRFAK